MNSCWRSCIDASVAQMACSLSSACSSSPARCTARSSVGDMLCIVDEKSATKPSRGESSSAYVSRTLSTAGAFGPMGAWIS